MKQISHYATITEVLSGRLKVKFRRYSACHNCDMRHGCGLMACQDKIIEIATPHAAQFRVGEEVAVSMAQNTGFWAVFLSYVLPLILMLAALTAAQILWNNELISGISAIIILIPYYFGLFLRHKSLAEKFRFTVSKISD